MPDLILQSLIAKNGLTATRILEPQSGYRNQSFAVTVAGGKTINLILYKSEPGILDKIQSANRVSNYLATRGLPTRQTLGRIIKIQSKTRPGSNSATTTRTITHTATRTTTHTTARTKYACLYNYLSGGTIPWEAYTMDHIKLLGLAMSRMHAELSKIPEPAKKPEPTKNSVPSLPPIVRSSDNVVGESEALLRRMQKYFAQPGVISALKAKLSLSLQPHALPSAKITLDLASKLPNHQPLHMDFVRGNILFGAATEHPETPLALNNLAITGIIDFEKTAAGPRIFDIARTLAFLMVDCKTKTPAQVAKYFLHSGYNKRGSMPFEPPIITTNGRRTDLLRHLINFYLLHDFYKFLLHNPYEYLPQNEHFTRTRSLLLALGLLSSPESLGLLHARIKIT